MDSIAFTSVFGIGLDAILIVMILGIPIFFLWRWIFSRAITSVRKRRALTWVTTIILAPLIYAGIIVVWAFVAEYYPKRTFDRTAWIANKEKRYEYADDVINSKMLIGKTKAEVKKLLGDDKNKDGSDLWIYYLGTKPEFLAISSSLLEIDFKNDTVERAWERYNSD